MAYSGSFRSSLPLPGWYLTQESDQTQLHYSSTPQQESSTLQRKEARTLEVPGGEQLSSCASTPPLVLHGLPPLASRSRLVRVRPSPCQLQERDSYSDVGTPRAFINLTNRHRRRRSQAASQHNLVERTSKGKAFWAVYQELIDTEESYLASLHTILDLFMSPMERSNAIPHRDFRLLFPAQLEQLVTIHSNLLQDLKSASHDEEEIGRVFLQLFRSRQVGFASVYGAYVNSFQTSCQMLHKYLRDSYFRTVYEACLQDPQCKGLDLLAYLLTPIQRLPRYRLLLRELLRRLPCVTLLEQALRLLEADLSALDSAILQATHCHIMQDYRQLRRNRRRLGSIRRPKKSIRWSGASWTSSSSASPVDTTGTLSHPQLRRAAASADTTTRMRSSSPVRSIQSQQQLCMSTPELLNGGSYIDHDKLPAGGTSVQSIRCISLLDIHCTGDTPGKPKDKKGLGRLIKRLFHKR